MKTYKIYILTLTISLVLFCKQKDNDSSISENEIIENSEKEKKLSDEPNILKNEYDSVLKLLNAILNEQNKLDSFFKFPLNEQNLIYWVESFNHDANYSQVKEVSKSFFYENIDIYFSKNFKKCLSKCDIVKLQNDSKSSYETDVNGNKLKIELTLDKTEFKISYYEEFFDDNDQMKYESVIEYIFVYENNSLRFKNANIAN